MLTGFLVNVFQALTNKLFLSLYFVLAINSFRAKLYKMSNYRDLEIYQLSFALAKRVHNASLRLPSFELYEQGSQVRRSSKSIKDQIAEGYGRRRYKPEFIKFLIYAQSSCDEAISQLTLIIELYPEISDFYALLPGYNNPGEKNK